jgi:EAL domain-containing protein (putative c-di-GMP-specific phosphodiesterase class I)
LQKSELPPHLLELELTETCLIEDPDVVSEVLHKLKALGLQLAVDDFGTGYSALAYICRFPLDSVKLDRSFLLQKHQEDVNPRKLARAVINLAHTLNLSVVAEGVETKDHFNFLHKTACDEIQGFCISKPLPPVDFEKLLLTASIKPSIQQLFLRPASKRKVSKSSSSQHLPKRHDERISITNTSRD